MLLDRLLPSDLRVVVPALDVVELAQGDVLYPGNAEGDLRYVYFPLTAVTSMLAMLADGSSVEAGTVGREGIVGVQCVLGSPRMFERWIAQVPGTALRIRTDEMRRIAGERGELRASLQRFTQYYLAFLSQTIACNARHPLVERCARWLLLTHDRAGRDQFSLTQEYLAIMLGVRRPAVSIAAATLARAGFIAYARGLIVVTNRAGLRSAACECYGAMQVEYERLFAAPLAGKATAERTAAS